MPSPFVLVGPDKPGHVTTLLMLSHFFLVKAFLHIHLAGATTFFVRSCPAHPILSLKNQTFLSFLGHPAEKKTKTNIIFFLLLLKEVEPVGAECAKWSCGHLQGPLYSIGAIWGVEWEENTAAGGGNTVIYGGNIVCNLE